MQIILAPIYFEGCLSAVEACTAMEAGIKDSDFDVKLVKLPIPDGGVGSAETFVAATNGRLIKTLAQDPLGRLVTGCFGLSGDGFTALIEAAAVSGKHLLSEYEKNPLKTSSFGTGQLILAALDAGARRIILGLRGCAIFDGGLGLARALGAQFMDANGFELGEGGQELHLLKKLDLSGLDPRVQQTEFLVGVDPNKVMTGVSGAALGEGLLMGLSEGMIGELERGLANLCQVIAESMQKDIVDIPGTGTGGGVAGGLVAFLKAKLLPEFDLMLEAVNYKGKLAEASLVITGAGRLDERSKVISSVANLAKAAGVAALALLGRIDEDYEALYETGIVGVMGITPGPVSEGVAFTNVKKYLSDSSARALKLFLAGRQSKVIS